jgi:hypothetical protein
MINVVGRPPLDPTRVRLCTFEHVLCDTSGMPCDWLPCHTEELRQEAMVRGTMPITLETLGAIRRDPCCSAENFVLDSCDDAARELEAAFGAAEGVAVVCDLTNVDEGRDVDGLAHVAARLGDSVAVCFGASLPAADVARSSEDELRIALERQLVVGVDVAADVARIFAAGAPATPRAAFVGPLRPAFDEGTDQWGRCDPMFKDGNPDIPYIRAAAAAASHQGAPVVVVLPAYGDNIALLMKCVRAVLNLAEAPTWIFRVARLDDAMEFPSNLGDVVDLASNIFGIFDGWDRPCDRGPRPPRAEDLSGHMLPLDRIVVAAGVRYRTQLRKYGGPGYAAGINAVRDAAESYSNDDDDMFDADTSNDKQDINFVAAVPRLAWYRPLKKRPVDVVTLNCSRCGRSFEVRRGHHFGKFDYAYCGRGCLDAHRDSGFDAADVNGPTASAQGL